MTLLWFHGKIFDIQPNLFKDEDECPHIPSISSDDLHPFDCC